MLISMDMSMRSSGIIAMTSKNEMIGYEVIKTSLADFPDHEDTIIYIIGQTARFMTQFCEDPEDSFVIEGLAHGAKSGSKDVIAGIFWGVRTDIWTRFPKMKIGVVPVTSWRSTVLNKEDCKHAKENFTPKTEAIKKATVNKLPRDVYDLFSNYIDQAGIDKKSIYDLTDAYFLGVYRNSLNANHTTDN